MGADKNMNTLTLRDFVEQLTRTAQPEARVVFRTSGEELALDKIQAVSPCTEILVDFDGEIGQLKKELADMENNLSVLRERGRERNNALEMLREHARRDKWDSNKILQELEGV